MRTGRAKARGTWDNGREGIVAKDRARGVFDGPASERTEAARCIESVKKRARAERHLLEEISVLLTADTKVL